MCYKCICFDQNPTWCYKANDCLNYFELLTCRNQNILDSEMWTSKLFVLALTFFGNCKKSNAEPGGYLIFKESGAIFLKINHRKNWECCFWSQFTVSMNSDDNKLLSYVKVSFKVSVNFIVVPILIKSVTDCLTYYTAVRRHCTDWYEIWALTDHEIYYIKIELDLRKFSNGAFSKT